MQINTRVRTLTAFVRVSVQDEEMRLVCKRLRSRVKNGQKVVYPSNRVCMCVHVCVHVWKSEEVECVKFMRVKSTRTENRVTRGWSAKIDRRNLSIRGSAGGAFAYNRTAFHIPVHQCTRLDNKNVYENAYAQDGEENVRAGKQITMESLKQNDQHSQTRNQGVLQWNGNIPHQKGKEKDKGKEKSTEIRVHTNSSSAYSVFT